MVYLIIYATLLTGISYIAIKGYFKKSKLANKHYRMYEQQVKLQSRFEEINKNANDKKNSITTIDDATNILRNS